MREGGQEKVAETVPLQPAAVGKAVVKELREQGLILGERHEAVADVARGQDAELAAQPSRTSAFIGDGHHGGEASDVRLKQGGAYRLRNMVLQPSQESRETGTSANGHDLHRSAFQSSTLLSQLCLIGHRIALQEALAEAAARA